MSDKQLVQAAKRALRAAEKFRRAAIDADAMIQTYGKKRNTATDRLRSLAELMPLFAVDAVLETVRNTESGVAP